MQRLSSDITETLTTARNSTPLLSQRSGAACAEGEKPPQGDRHRAEAGGDRTEGGAQTSNSEHQRSRAGTRNAAAMLRTAGVCGLTGALAISTAQGVDNPTALEKHINSNDNA